MAFGFQKLWVQLPLLPSLETWKMRRLPPGLWGHLTVVRAQHGQRSPKISLLGSETSHPFCFPWLECRVPDWSRRIAVFYCHVSGVIYTVVQCLLPLPSRPSCGRRTCPGGMDNELWVDMTCASLGHMLPEPSCCSIFLSPCRGSCMPGMGAAPSTLVLQQRGVEQRVKDNSWCSHM